MVRLVVRRRQPPPETIMEVNLMKGPKGEPLTLLPWPGCPTGRCGVTPQCEVSRDGGQPHGGCGVQGGTNAMQDAAGWPSSMECCGAQGMGQTHSAVHGGQQRGGPFPAEFGQGAKPSGAQGLRCQPGTLSMCLSLTCILTLPQAWGSALQGASGTSTSLGITASTSPRSSREVLPRRTGACRSGTGCSR